MLVQRDIASRMRGRRPLTCRAIRSHPQPLRALAGKHKHRLAHRAEHAPLTTSAPGSPAANPANPPSAAHGRRRRAPPDARTPTGSTPATNPRRPHPDPRWRPRAPTTAPPDWPTPRAERADSTHGTVGSIAISLERQRFPARPGLASRITCAFVPLMPNETPPPDAAGPPRPRPRLGQQRHRSRRPIHMRRRHIHMQRLAAAPRGASPAPS